MIVSLTSWNGCALPRSKQNRRHATTPTGNHRLVFASVNAVFGLSLLVKVACSESLAPEQLSLPLGRFIVKSCSLLFYFFRSSIARKQMLVLLGNRGDYITFSEGCQYPFCRFHLKRNDHTCLRTLSSDFRCRDALPAPGSTSLRRRIPGRRRPANHAPAG